MSILNHSDLNADITTTIDNNGSEAITGLVLQQRLLNLADSAVNKLGDLTIQGLLRYSILPTISNGGDLTHKTYVDGVVSAAISSLSTIYLALDGSNYPSSSINWNAQNIRNIFSITDASNNPSIAPNNRQLYSASIGAISRWENGFETTTNGFYALLDTSLLGSDNTFKFPSKAGVQTFAMLSDLTGIGTGTVTSVSVVTANGVSGSVANPTTTPAITLTLGDITPSSVAATGTITGSNLSGTNTGDQIITLTGDVTGSGIGSFATTIGANKVLDTMIRQSGALSIIGRASNSTGNIADISSSADNQFFVRRSSALTWGGLAAADITSAYSFTNGSVMFWNSGFSQDNSNFFYDNTNKIFYIGANSGAFTNTKLDTTGTVNSYLQNNLQNLSAGTIASSDWVATADTGTDTTKFVNLGINSSGNTDATLLGGTLNSYVYSNGGNLSLGTQSAGKDLIFFAGGTAVATNKILTLSGTNYSALFNAGIVASATFTLTGGATTINNKTITYSSNTVVKFGDTVTGTGIPVNTYIQEVLSATSSTISINATATNTGLTFTIQPMPYGLGIINSITNPSGLYTTGVYISPTFSSNSVVNRSLVINHNTTAGVIGGGAALEIINKDEAHIAFVGGTSGSRVRWNMGVGASGAASAGQFFIASGTTTILAATSSSINIPNNVILTGGFGPTSFKIGGGGGTTNVVYSIELGSIGAQSGGALAITSGTAGFVSIGTGFSTQQFAPTSGTAAFNALNIQAIWNQTGTASGPLRSIYINSTNTSILGTYNAIESTSGNWVIGGATNAPILQIHNNGSTALTALSSNSTGLLTLASGFNSIKISGGVLHPINQTAKTTTYTATTLDYTIVCDATSAGFTVNLPTAASFYNATTTTAGGIFVIKKIDSSSNVVTIDGNGSETIDGSLTQLLYLQYQSLVLQTDGTTWRILSGGIKGRIIGSASFLNNADFTFASINTATAITYNVNSLVQGALSHSTSSNTSRVTANQDGILQVIVNNQVLKAAAGTEQIYFWFRKNGSDVANSGYAMQLSNGENDVFVINSTFNVIAGDYFEAFASVTNTGITLDAIAASSPVPLIPSTIMDCLLFSPLS